MLTVLALQVGQIEGWFKKHAEVEGVSRDGGETTARYSEPVADATELVLVASTGRCGCSREVDEAADIMVQLLNARQQMQRLVETYAQELDTTKTPSLQEMLIRRYREGDATRNRHRDTFSLAVLQYWGDFIGGELEYEVGSQVASVAVKQGDIVVMCGSRIRHGCGKLLSGDRYALVGFHDLVVPVPLKKRRVI